MKDFDSTYSITEAINEKIGGESKNFDSTYSICKEILDKVEQGGGGSGTTYVAGENIEIKNNTINAVGYKYNSNADSFAEIPLTESDDSLYEPIELTEDQKAILGDYTYFNQDDTDYDWQQGNPIYKITYDDETNEQIDVLVGHITNSQYISNEEEGMYGMLFNTDTPITFDNDYEYYVRHLGTNNEALGLKSHAEGLNTHAIGNYSHAENTYCQAIGDNSHAEGYSSKASGETSHAEGLNTHAIGNYSHAEGGYCTTRGSFSHAHGYKASTNTNAQAATAMGYEVIAWNPNEVAIGMYNDDMLGLQPSSTTLFCIGNGSATNYRKNALVVMRNGDVYLRNVGNYNGYQYKWDSNSIKTLQEVINEGKDYYNGKAMAVGALGTIVYNNHPAQITVDGSYGYILVRTNTDINVDFDYAPVSPISNNEVLVDIVISNNGTNTFKPTVSGNVQLMNNDTYTLSEGQLLLLECKFAPTLNTWLVKPSISFDA